MTAQLSYLNLFRLFSLTSNVVTRLVFELKSKNKSNQLSWLFVSWNNLQTEFTQYFKAVECSFLSFTNWKCQRIIHNEMHSLMQGAKKLFVLWVSSSDIFHRSRLNNLTEECRSMLDNFMMVISNGNALCLIRWIGFEHVTFAVKQNNLHLHSQL